MIRRIGWWVMTVLALIIAAYAIALLFIPAMRAPFLQDRFATVPLLAYLHLAGAGIALAIGPFQLNTRLRSRFLHIHRWMGRTYVICVLLGGTAALALATMSQAGLVTHVGFGLLAALWLFATGTAYRRIRVGDQVSHRRWMIRSYALTFAAVTLRIYLPLSQIAGLPFDAAYQTISWLCWVPNLIVAEWIILRQQAPAVVSQPSRVSALLSVIAFQASAQQRTYANPIDIDYRYNFEQKNEGISYRSGADPVIVVQRGKYYLFETIGDGYWESSDLGSWRHITPSRWPLTDLVAPAVLAVRDTIYLLPSTTSPLPILMLTEPASGRVEFYNRLLPWLPMARAREADVLAKPDSVQPGPWDPQFFYDPDTDRWFLYWNSSNAYPLHVIELDKGRQLAYRGTPKWLFGLDPAQHGWERFGQDHRDSTIKPFIEGSWMTKHAGRYYLQYGAPGTEYNVYATGVYTAADPLGPFTYAPYNPVAYKPGGFVQGAGHGNTFQDVYGNWWNTGTPWIAVNWNFERRIGLHPAGFDADGQLHVDTRFGDFPHWLPTKPGQASDELFTGWMLLSYRKAVTASSTLDSFLPSRVTDENPRTFWVPRQNRPGESLTIDLGGPYDVKAIQVNYADYKSGLYGTDSTVVTRFRLQASPDGREWAVVADLSREARDRPNAYIEMATPVRARFVRYDHIHVGAANLAISDIRVFGTRWGGGPRPATPGGLTARRDRDARNAVITWKPVAGVVGYNVRWGIAPAKLYQTYQRFADQGTTLELRALTVGQAYWVAIESFDENGVSTLSRAVPIR